MPNQEEEQLPVFMSDFIVLAPVNNVPLIYHNGWRKHNEAGRLALALPIVACCDSEGVIESRPKGQLVASCAKGLISLK
jgi:hypothetical protein